MKYLTKKNIITILLIAFVISLVVNVYFFGGRWLEKDRQEQKQIGARNTMSQIIRIAEQQGQLVITKDDNSQIVLIKQ